MYSLRWFLSTMGVLIKPCQSFRLLSPEPVISENRQVCQRDETKAQRGLK